MMFLVNVRNIDYEMKYIKIRIKTEIKCLKPSLSLKHTNSNTYFKLKRINLCLENLGLTFLKNIKLLSIRENKCNENIK